MSPLATPRGGLRVVAATVALVTFALSLARLGDEESMYGLAYSVQHLVGWRVAGVVLLVACGAWLWLAAIEAVTQSRWAVHLGVAVLVTGAPFTYRAWEDAYWTARPWVSSHRVDGSASNRIAGSTWRGTTNGACGNFALYEVTFDTDSTGTGHALASSFETPLFSAVSAFGTYKSSRSRAVRAVVLNDSLWLDFDGAPLIPRSATGPDIYRGGETMGPFALGG